MEFELLIGMPAIEDRAMLEIASSTVVVMLAALLALVVLLLVWLVMISRGVARIERVAYELLRLAETAPEAGLSHGDKAAAGVFEAFLDEDPARRMLPKAEQFAAYRQWRRDKGMNWSNS